MLKLTRLALLLILAIPATSTTSWAGTYWIDGSRGSDAANCGTGPGTQACRSYYFLNASGCDANGCLNNIQTDLTNGVGATINFTCKNTGGACTGIQSYSGNGNGKPLCIGFDGTQTSPLNIKCVDGAGAYSPLNCKISGSGVSFDPQMAVVVFGATATTCLDEGNGVSYVKLSGFRIEDIPAANAPSGIRTRSNSPHHIKISDCRIDGGTTANSDLGLMVSNTHHMTYVNNVVTNCAPNGVFGCFGFQQPSSNLAGVGNHFGPRRDFPGPYAGGGSNLDCHTLQGTNRALLDGNECFKTADGMDNGMLDTTKTQNLIVRYNDLHDVHGNSNLLGSRLAKVSGDAGTNTSAENLIFYKNVFRHTDPAYWDGGIWVTELARNIDYWYNTMYGAQNRIDDASIQYYALAGVSGVSSYYNIVDGTTTNNMVGPCGNSSNHVCPIWNVGFPACASGACKWVGNRLWFAERGPSAPCIREYLTGVADATYNCDLSRYGGGSDFNSVASNTGNLRADPHFVKRGGTALTDFELTSASTAYLDAGGGFCSATSSGSGNTVNVTCRGLTTDPRFYFPQPSDYYDLSNDECKGKGVRVGDSVNPGCYDIQIAGPCGVHQITSMTASSITFNGPSCSWTSGAMVHLPWDGAAPDVGAMEGFSGGIHAPVLLEVVPTNGP